MKYERDFKISRCRSDSRYVVYAEERVETAAGCCVEDRTGIADYVAEQQFDTIIGDAYLSLLKRV